MNAFSTYISKNSFLHRLNPSLKFMCGILIIIMIFLPIGFLGQIIIFTIVVSLWFSSKLSWKTMKGIIKSVLIMFTLVFLINWVSAKSPSLLNVDGTNFFFFFNNWDLIGNVITKVNGIQVDHHFVFSNIWGGTCLTDSLYTTTPTDSAYSYVSCLVDGQTYYLYYQTTWYSLSSLVLFNTIYITTKIFLMITIITLIISTTTPVQLTFAIEDILSPLGYLKLPVNEWSMTISIAIRFVPSLISESQKILKAQASRGVDFSYGKLPDKIKAIVSLVVPMFSVAFHKADELANAMEARSYNPRYTRTRYRSYPIKWNEWILFFVLAIILGLLIMLNAYNCVFAPFGWVETLLICG